VLRRSMIPMLPHPRSPTVAVPLDVLLVEDMSAHAVLISEQLRDGMGGKIRIAHVTTLAEARRHLGEHGADCILLDLTLPDARGLEAIEAIRGAADDIPVVVVSALDDDALAVQAVHQGAQDYLVKGQASGPVIARAIRYAVERQQAEVKLARLALHDPLTGLPNRTMFIDRVEQAFARQARTGRALAVLFLDLDRFKLVNDTLGHDAGDQLLVQVAQRLSAAVRPSDTIARFGGDEFTILCESLVSPGAVMVVADRVQAAFVEPFGLAGDELFVTPSIGVATAERPTDGPHGLLRNADAAMYRAKARGGGCELFDARMRASTTCGARSSAMSSCSTTSRR
jgi:diguanylate cyclase (GGDEF)-like protein